MANITAEVEPRGQRSQILQTLDHHLDAIRFWQRSVNAPSFSRAFKDHYEGLVKTGMPLHEYLGKRLDVAETALVRSNIISKLWRLSETHTTTEEGLLPSDLPCERAYVWLEHPVYITDARGQKCSIRVIFWSKEHNGIIVAFMSDALDAEDRISRQTNEIYGQFKALIAGSRTPLMHLQAISWGEKLRNLNEAQFHKPPLMSEDYYENFMDQHNQAVQDLITMYNFLMSLWEFMGEQIPYSVPLDRPHRRRLVRENSPMRELLVVDLRPVRNPYPHSENPQEVIWNHRWRVREHKRRWIDKNGNHRETTVSSYVKGPDHLPLVEKDRVYHVRR